ncbi:DUF4157 domain-containing protein [Fluviicola taffensis]|uniref:eCIS core domain-containing protein n=1 Tax=Fluviicola taffensis TaxID=191579 RepID=UPI0031380008
MKTKVQSPDKPSGAPFRSRGGTNHAVQAKLSVNQPGDQHEAEADSAAERVVNGASPTGTTSANSNAVQLKPIAQTVTPRIQRKEAPGQMGQLDVEGTEDKMAAIGHEGIIQRKEDLSMGNDVLSPAPLGDKLQETKGQGNPLPSGVKTEMESGFGADFSGVRTHTGTKATDMNQSLKSKAFTNQGDIYFNEGNLDPNSKEGKQLLAHELTHTIQQGAATPAAGKDNKSNPEQKNINPADVAQAKNQAKNTPGTEEKAEKLVNEATSEAKGQQPAAVNQNAVAEKQPEDLEKKAEEANKKEEKSKEETEDAKEGKVDAENPEKNAEAVDKAVEKEVKGKAKEEPKEEKAAHSKGKGSGEKEKSEEGEEKKAGEGKGKKEEDPGPDGVKEDYKNPPPVKDAKVDEATDKVGEGVGVDEEANVNVEGLIMTSQQFRDQGKESVNRAEKQAEKREEAEKKKREIDKKIEGSDKALKTADKNTDIREKKMTKIMEKAIATSKQRQEKVSGEVGGYADEVKKNKATAGNLKNKSAGLNKGSKENSNPEEKESGELSSNYEEMESGTATMADGITGVGNVAAKQKADAKTAKTKNAKTEKDYKQSKANIQKSKQKISSEKNRNTDAKSKSKSLKPKFQASKKQEEQLTKEGKSLMKTSFEMENETHRAQYFYYKDMKTIEGADEMIMQEELRAQSELSNGPEALLFRYANMKGDAEREAFVASLSEQDKNQLGMQLMQFNMNFEAWIENKKLELGDRVERKRAEKIDHYNGKRNKGLQSPLNKATKNIDKISKTGLMWTSMTKSLEAMWEGLKNITWADVSKLGLAMINPLETYNTIADAVGGIWTDLSNWEGFSENPVGMILQKGSSVGVKLLTIAGVITGLLYVLSALTSVAAFFFPPLIPVAAWLIGAAATMTTVTFWLGLITTILSVLSGIKNIYNVHTAKTAEEIYQGNNKIKTDAANTTAGVMAMVGAKSPPQPFNMSKLGTMKNMVVKTYKASKGFIKRGVRKIPRLVSKSFKKETWSGLYTSFKKFSTKKADNLFGGGNKNQLANKTDKLPDVAPKKVLKNADQTKVPSQTTGTTSKFEKRMPDKTKPVDLDNTTTTKTPDLDPNTPATNKLPETNKLSEPSTSDLKKVDTKPSDASVEKLNNDIDPQKSDLDKTAAPKDQQVANGEKPPKSEILEDDPNLKDRELDDLKKYEDDVDASTKKKMEDKADGDIEKGKNHKSKMKALVMARIITETNDKLDTPVPALLAELAPLRAMKGVEKFATEGGQNGKFHIFMFGCKNELNKPSGYDVNSENEGNDKEEKNDQNSLDDAKKIIENEWEVIPSNLKYDKGAHDLAKEIGGVPQACFKNTPNIEYDAISDEFIGQHKPALKANIGSSFKKQAKRTFEVAKETGRKVIYRFDSEPAPEVIEKLNEYSARYGVELVIRF